MSQEITRKVSRREDELLEIYEVQFRYNKKESILENTKGYWIKNNPSCEESKYAGRKEERESKIYRNEDYYSDEIKELLEKHPSIENSLKIWNTLSKADSKKLIAIYIPNETFKKKNPYSLTFPSRIIHLLKQYNWIPDKEGNFHKPCEPNFYRENVHSDFKINNQNLWLDKIGLLSEKREQEQRKRRKEAAKILGFTMEEVELFTKYKEIKVLESENL